MKYSIKQKKVSQGMESRGGFYEQKPAHGLRREASRRGGAFQERKTGSSKALMGLLQPLSQNREGTFVAENGGGRWSLARGAAEGSSHRASKSVRWVWISL